MKLKILLLVGLVSLGVAACSGRQPVTSAAEPTTTPETLNPLPARQRAVEACRALLAAQLSVDQLSILPLDVTPVDWPDTCLGVASAGEACAQVVTPGFRVRLQEGGVTYEFHTDRRATQIRQVR